MKSIFSLDLIHEFWYNDKEYVFSSYDGHLDILVNEWIQAAFK